MFSFDPQKQLSSSQLFFLDSAIQTVTENFETKFNLVAYSLTKRVSGGFMDSEYYSSLWRKRSELYNFD